MNTGNELFGGKGHILIQIVSLAHRTTHGRISITNYGINESMQAQEFSTLNGVLILCNSQMLVNFQEHFDLKTQICLGNAL